MTGEVRSYSPERDVRETKRLAHGVLKVAGHDTFSEVAQLDHQHDSVGLAGLRRSGGQRAQDVKLGVEARVAVPYNLVHLTQHRRPNKHHRRRYSRATHRLDVLDAGVADRGYARIDQSPGDVG